MNGTWTLHARPEMGTAGRSILLPAAHREARKGRECSPLYASASPWPSRSRARPSSIAGCGHPATAEECNAIIAKSAELELRAQNVTDPAVIAQRIEAVKTARGEELLKRCVGKRITERALACVGRAGSPKEVDACLE